MRPIFVFFFSSRRRHTRLTCDWSSDVCSSDLSPAPAQSAGVSHAATAARAMGSDWIDLGPLDDLPEGRPALRPAGGGDVAVPLAVVRRGVRVDVFIGVCSHLSGPLYEGTVEAVHGTACLVCPWHGS